MELSTIFRGTWEDFCSKLFPNKCRCKSELPKKRQLYGLFWNEDDIRFHFSKMFFDRIKKRDLKWIGLFSEHPFDPRDWEDEPPEEKMYNVLGIKKKQLIKKKGWRPPKIDFVVRHLNCQDRWADVCAEFKYFNVIRRGWERWSLDKLDGLGKQLERLNKIKRSKLTIAAFMCIVDEFYYWNEREHWKNRFEKFEEDYRGILLHFKVPKYVIKNALEKGFRDCQKI